MAKRSDSRVLWMAAAILAAALLAGAKLRQVNLCGARLTGALLRGADLTGARCDAHTRWPPGFDPQRHGVTQVE